MIKILFVCHGNICRSTMCEFVFKYMVDETGIAHKFSIDSAATSTEEIGSDTDPRTKAKLRENGIPFTKRRARQITRKDYDTYDYLIGMDEANICNIMRISGGDPDGKIHMLLDFTDRKGEAIADPWYTGNFDRTYDDVWEGCKALLKVFRD